MSETFLNGRVTLHPGDCLDVLARLEENSIDACVTDPPYHLTSIVKRFGADNAAPAKTGKTGAYARASRGFMGKQWDGGEIAFEPETWAAVLRVLKPGGHLCAFGAPKNFGFMQYAIAQAGFEVRDVLCWLFGSGFPKSHDVSKGIDRANGDDRPVISSRKAHDIRGGNLMEASQGHGIGSYEIDITSAASAASAAWDGWGTALKPAYEPILLCRKPLSEPTIAANVLRWSVGALNIDGCRVASADDLNGGCHSPNAVPRAMEPGGASRNVTAGEYHQPLGRWPANVILDSSEEVQGAFPETTSGALNAGHKQGIGGDGYGQLGGERIARDYGNDSGSAARFFYTAKADSDDRLGSKHPTVKPIDLMQYLCRLITPPKGTILDLFAGTGTTGEAAWREGFSAILIEREAEYQNDIRRRMALCMSGPDERQRESIKERMKGKPVDAGPLFAGSANHRADGIEVVNE